LEFESPENHAENRDSGDFLIVRPSKYRVRLAGRADLHLLPAIERMANERFREYGLGQVYDRCVITAEEFEARQHRGTLWLAVTARDRPIGFATCSQLDDVAHLDEIDVLPQHGRRGVGTLLLRTVCTWARSGAYPAVTLSTTRGVPWNEPFYRRWGFREIAENTYTAGLRRLRAAEAAAGLPVARRLMMRRDFVSRGVFPGCESSADFPSRKVRTL